MTDATSKTTDESKELKRLLDAHIEVAKARLGRAPSLDDIHQMLTVTHSASANQTPVASKPTESGEPKQQVKSPQGATTELEEGLQKDSTQDPSVLAESELKDPAILGMKVYYGLGSSPDGSEKKPDPNKVLFYESHDGRAYDCNANSWCDQRPPVLDHLASRPIQFNERDIVAAIAHGVMEDGDFDALDKAQMISETPRKLWGLKKKLMGQVQELEKSQAANTEEFGTQDVGTESNDSDFDMTPEGDFSTPYNSSAGINLFNKIKELSGAGLQSEEAEVAGEDVLSQIIQAATSEALTGMEDLIRAIVRDEMGLSSQSSDSGQMSEEEDENGIDEEPSQW